MPGSRRGNEMIVGVGTDLVEMDRMKKACGRESFLKRRRLMALSKMPNTAQAVFTAKSVQPKAPPTVTRHTGT